MVISHTGSDCDGWSFPRPKQPGIWKSRVGGPRPRNAVTSLLQLNFPRHHGNPFAWCQRLGIHSIFPTKLIRLLPYFIREEKQFLPQAPGAPLPRPLMGATATSLPLALFVTGGEVDDEPTDQVVLAQPFPFLTIIYPFQIMRYMPEEQRWELQDWKLPLPSAHHDLLTVDIGLLCT